MDVADGLDVAGLVEEVENHRRSSEEEEEDTHAEVNADRLGPPRSWRHRKVLPEISSDYDNPVVDKLQLYFFSCESFTTLWYTPVVS